ncbi:Deaminase [Tumidithrix helvetica PCC 7403]
MSDRLVPSDIPWLERVAEIRVNCNLPSPSRNVAIARCWIEETFFELFAISGKTDRKGSVGLPKQVMFELLDPPPGHFRGLDSEYKLLEEIASRYTQNKSIKGRIELFTERKPCLSCCYVINQFRQAFPNIELSILDTDVVQRRKG